VHVIGGILWVSQPYGGARVNYCGDPANGLPRAALAMPLDSQFPTADARYFYYLRGLDHPRAEQLVRARIDPRCR
jgi:hypothetical protein